MVNKNNFNDLLTIDENGQEVIAAEINIAESGDVIAFPWLLTESIIDDPIKRTGKWSEYIQIWQSEGRI